MPVRRAHTLALAGALPRLPTAAAIGATALLLAAPALWNGLPLLYYDSGDYMAPHLVAYRDPVYSLLIAPLHAGWSLWPVVAAQSLLAAWLLFETVAAFATPADGPPPANPATGASALAVMAGLGTALPWFTSQIMPDALAGLGLLGLALLAFAPLPNGKRTAVGAVTAAAAAAHLSHLLVAVAVLAALVVLRGWLRPRLGVAALAVVAAGFAVPSASVALGGSFALSPTGPVFLLGRMVQDGLAARTLDAVCPDPRFTLCAWRGRLPASANDFLWNGDPAFDAMGGWDGAAPEARALALASLKRFPLAHLASCLKLTGQQIVQLRTGAGLVPQWEAAEGLQRFFPDAVAPWRRSPEAQGRLPFAAINHVHVPLALAAVAALPVALALAWRRRRPAQAGLCAVVLLGLLANATICASLSNPDDRYQSRVAWVALVAVGVVAGRREAR